MFDTIVVEDCRYKNDKLHLKPGEWDACMAVFNQVVAERNYCKKMYDDLRKLNEKEKLLLAKEK